MPVGELVLLAALWTLCVATLGLVICRKFRAQRFSFDFCFSVAFLITCYLGFPLSVALVVGFGERIVSTSSLAGALLLPMVCYGVYHLARSTRRSASAPPRPARWFAANQRVAGLTAVLLAAVAVGTLVVFIAQNGLLLFKVDTYSQAFTKDVSGQALKRFSYFFIPAALIWYFLRPRVRRWWIFLAATAGFGLLGYVAVGGTRANLALAFALFLFIGLAQGYLKPKLLIPLGFLGVAGMFLLALARYGLHASGMRQLYYFLYLTRDSLSPWENLALVLERRSTIEFQGLAPIARDFSVYVPRSIWPDRPEVVLNTANYFSRAVLGRGPGLTISPTMIGSSYLMGGLLAVPLTGAAAGLIIRGLDRLHRGAGADGSGGAVAKAFCFGTLFTLVVLVREGLDSFCSRFVIYLAVFGLCFLAAKAVFKIRQFQKPEVRA
ncbi:WzyE family oligosaccharide polymerase [Amycolatopsis panacis]|uniref:O-antigen assembly polymerase n=1 Tax=Amycolatopsis panacis TaxID=2340917 RepID=A0A419I8C3_9PSEU|nr:WzyE family oligosaccharide polymerase [Amycolatopsis panacis]RJQ88416.1 O-antigen assembly polymerase [Amycolatopsis panacis]